MNDASRFEEGSIPTPIHTILVPCLLALALLWPGDARAGAWAQEDMGLYAKLSAAHARATRQYKTDGETFQLLSEDEKGDYRSTALFLYAEYGLLPSLTITVSGSLTTAVVESRLIRIRTTGLSDVHLGAKYQFLDSPFVLSVGVDSRIPTGYTPDPAAAKAPTLGLGVYAWEGHLQIGKSFYPVPVYASANAGFRYRGSRTSRGGETVDYPPELPYAAEIGYSPFDWLTIRARADGVHGFGDPEDLNAFSLSPLTQSYLNVGPGLVFDLPGALQLDLGYRYTVTGVNTVASHTATLGIAVDTTLGGRSEQP